MRLIARREQAHPGARLRIGDDNGWRATVLATNLTDRRLAELERVYRLRARAEDRSRPFDSPARGERLGETTTCNYTRPGAFAADRVPFKGANSQSKFWLSDLLEGDANTAADAGRRWVHNSSRTAQRGNGTPELRVSAAR